MAALAWALWALTLVAFALMGWFDRLLTQAGRPDLALGTSDVPAFVLATLSATTVGPCWPAAALATRWAGCCSGSGSRWPCPAWPPAMPTTG
jgi:hypothetical protein